jgi:UDP-N-acetylmuramyl tripeptide synthase
MQTQRILLLSGFNRHGDLPVIEAWLSPDDGESEALESGAWRAQFGAALARVCTGSTADEPEIPSADAGVQRQCAAALAAATLRIQRAAGFDVDRCGALDPVPVAAIRFFAEIDLEDAGIEAFEIAAGVLVSLLHDDRRRRDAALDRLSERFEALKRLAERRATPADTRALIEAARRRRIPVLRMDREPCGSPQGDFRIRQDGLIRLGHGGQRLTLDGTFCVERAEALHPLVHDRIARLRHLLRMGLALPLSAGPDPRPCSSPLRAARTAGRIGFPVDLRTTTRTPDGVASGLADADAVRAAAGRLLAGGGDLVVERAPAGPVVEMLYLGGRLFSVFGRDAPWDCDPFDLRRAPAGARVALDGLAQELGLPCVSFALDTGDPDSNAPPMLIDADFAPALDRLFNADREALYATADRLLGTLFPPGTTARVPIAAITGTNGKTTTAVMVERILRDAGRVTGLACSAGSSVNGEEITQFEHGYLPGHLTVLDHPYVEAAVLETTRGAALTTGIGFDHCDVAACINVGNDHLEPENGVATVDDMARVKQWIVERGRRVVLNADDPRCRAMADALRDRRPVLVSTQSTAVELRASSGRDDVVAVVESVEGSDWLVLHDGDARLPLVAVGDIASTHDGRAVHNVSNALHAAAVAYLMGANPPAIAWGLAGLHADARQLPGRLNRFDAGEFEIVIDYAHNPAGLARLAEFCDRLNVPGRRIVAVSLPVNRGEQFVVDGVAAIAGHFDRYICKNYRITHGREPHEVPELLRRGLLRAGVPDERITMRAEVEDDAVAYALESAGPGDLVVLVVGKGFRDFIGQVERFIAARRAGNRPPSGSFQ